MRDLDDVFIELASKWDTLDTLTQRYVATQAAGSRQQSRFLALMNDYDGLMETLGYATDSAGASNEQFGKTMDSLESKLNGLKNAWTEFTTGITDSDLIKKVVVLLTDLLNGVNNLTGNSGLAKVVLLFSTLKVSGDVLATTLEKLGFNFENIGMKNMTLIKSVEKSKGNLSKLILDFKAGAQLLKEFNSGQDEFKVLWTDLLGPKGKIALVIVGLTALYRIIKSIINIVTKAKRTYEEYNKELNTTIKEQQEYFDKIKKVRYLQQKQVKISEDQVYTIEELIKGTDKYGNNLSLTNEALEVYNSLTQSLVDSGYVDNVEDANIALHDGTLNLQKYNDELDREIERLAWLKQSNYTSETRTGEQQTINDAREEYTKAQNYSVQLTAKELGAGIINFGGYGQIERDTKIGVERLQGKIDSNTKTAWQEVYNKYLERSQDLSLEESERQTAKQIAANIYAYLSPFDKQLEAQTTEAFKQIEELYQNEVNRLTSSIINTNAKFARVIDGKALVSTILGTVEDFNGPLDKSSESALQKIVNFDWEKYTPDLFQVLENRKQIFANSSSYADFNKKMLEPYKQLPEEIKKDVDELFSNAGISIEDFLQIEDTDTIQNKLSQTGLYNKLKNSGFDEQQIIDFIQNLSISARDAITNNAIDLIKLIITDNLNDISIQIEEQVKNLSTIPPKLYELVDAAKEAWDSITDINEEELKAGLNEVTGQVDKASIAYSRLTDEFAKFDAENGNVFESLGITSEALAEEYIRAQNDAEALDQYTWSLFLAQLAKNGLTDLSQELINEGAATWTAVEAWKAYTQAIKDGANAERLKALQTLALLKSASLSMPTSSTTTTTPTTTKQTQNNARASQDAFYNYINTIDDYTDALERLQAKQELLTDSSTIVDNLKAQEEEYQRLIGSTQSYLNEVDNQLNYLKQIGLSQYSAYVQIAEDGSLRLTQAYFGLTGDAAEEIDNWIESYDDVLGRQRDLNDELDSYKKELQDLFNDWRDAYVDLEDQIVDILKAADEKALEEKEDFYEELEKQSDDYLDAVRKNIEAERNARDRANQYEEVAKKERKLALLQRDTSGRYATDIAQLQEEINQSQQDLADEYIDKLLDQLEEQNDEEQKRHEEVLKAMQKQIDVNVETRAYIEEADAIIAQGEDAILEVLQSSEEYQQASDAKRQKMFEEWGVAIGNAQTYWGNIQQGILTANDYILRMVNALQTQQTANVIQATGNTLQSNTNNTENTGTSITTSIKKYKFFIEDDITGQLKYQSAAIYNSTQEAYQAGIEFQKKNKKLYGGYSVYGSIFTYKKGGLVDYTGPAWVDGTKGSPEAFLNANQTSIIGKLASMLERFTTNNSFKASSAQDFGSCNINIDIGNLGTDYDIDNAIAKVKNEILSSSQYRNINIIKRNR